MKNIEIGPGFGELGEVGKSGKENYVNTHTHRAPISERHWRCLKRQMAALLFSNTAIRLNSLSRLLEKYSLLIHFVSDDIRVSGNRRGLA